MYTKDKNTRITLRLNEEQFAFVKANADVLGVSPSEFLRMVVNSSMAMSRKVESATYQASKALEEGFGRENDKTNLNGQL